MAMEREPLRLLQKVPHEVFRSRKQGRTYTEEFQQSFFAALKGQVLKADEIAEEKSDEEEKEKRKKEDQKKKERETTKSRQDSKEEEENRQERKG